MWTSSNCRLHQFDMWIVKCFFLQELSSKSVAKHAGGIGTHSEPSFSEASQPHQKLAGYTIAIQMTDICQHQSRRQRLMQRAALKEEWRRVQKLKLRVENLSKEWWWIVILTKLACHPERELGKSSSQVYPDNLFARLFWSQQLKAAQQKSSKSMRAE